MYSLPLQQETTLSQPPQTKTAVAPIGGVNVCEQRGVGLEGPDHESPSSLRTMDTPDISTIGAIRALREAGRRLPEDVSVVGFDDIQSAAFQNPGLTTVKQPLRQMGVLAAETLLQRINAPVKQPYAKEIIVEPDLIIRGSSGPAPRSVPQK